VTVSFVRALAAARRWRARRNWRRGGIFAILLQPLAAAGDWWRRATRTRTPAFAAWRGDCCQADLFRASGLCYMDACAALWLAIWLMTAVARSVLGATGVKGVLLRGVRRWAWALISATSIGTEHDQYCLTLAHLLSVGDHLATTVTCRWRRCHVVAFRSRCI